MNDQPFPDSANLREAAEMNRAAAEIYLKTGSSFIDKMEVERVALQSGEPICVERLVALIDYMVAMLTEATSHAAKLLKQTAANQDSLADHLE